jgi:hypothetical protein
VAVSKTKSIENIIEAYNAGQRHFGENYVRIEEILKKCVQICHLSRENVFTIFITLFTFRAFGKKRMDHNCHPNNGIMHGDKIGRAALNL